MRTASLTLILIVALSVIHLGIYAQNVNIKYETEDLKRGFGALKSEIRNSSYIASKKKDLSRIENVAVRKLGMIRPSDLHYIVRPSTEAIAP